MDKTLNGVSKHFQLQQLGEGIFAAIAENGGFAISNSGLIDLGGQIVVFDTFLTPEAAMDLHHFVVDRYGHSPQIVINSHYHNDHIWGNQVFTEHALILSSVRTRELIATEGMEEFRWYSANSAERLKLLQAQYEKSNDEEQKQGLLLWMGEYGGVIEALPHLQVCMPGITFNRVLEFHGAERTAKLITFEGGHTGSDTVLFLPHEEIVFMSDLLFTNYHPYLAEGDPLMLLNALREIKQLSATSYVPGHGPVGTINDVNMLIEYIEQCIETAHMLVEKGTGIEEEINDLKIPDKYLQWKLPDFYRSNMRSLCKHLSSANINA